MEEILSAGFAELGVPVPDGALEGLRAYYEYLTERNAVMDLTAITGEEVSIDAHSICVHGDNPSAVEFVKNIRAKLEGDGVAIAPIAQIV